MAHTLPEIPLPPEGYDTRTPLGPNTKERWSRYKPGVPFVQPRIESSKPFVGWFVAQLFIHSDNQYERPNPLQSADRVETVEQAQKIMDTLLKDYLHKTDERHRVFTWTLYRPLDATTT